MPSSCSSALRFVAASIGLAAAPAFAAIDAEGAMKVFQEAAAICARDAGALWGRTLCGPILLVDPEDNALVANQADVGGVLKPAGAMFTGVLPASEILANTSVQWSGTLWTEMLWPLPEDAAKRRVMIAHELFHRIQPELGMARLDGGNQHLDTLEGRYLLQLEWRALAKALSAQDAAGRRIAVADALAFRQERHRRFASAAADEGALESNEGVAEYTGVRAGLATPQARTSHAIEDLSAFVASPSFVRSFAYATGPAYGLLLDQADPGWRDKLGGGRRMDQLLADAWHLPAAEPATLKARAAVYDDGSLRADEVKRDEARQRRLAALRERFVAGPVLTLPLAHASYQFNPQTLQPLDELGTVYPTLRLAGDFGVLEVEDGALMDRAMKQATVSAAGIDASALKGPGWHLVLSPGWTIQPGARKGDLVAMPPPK